MPQEYIEIRGARENNLKNVSLRIPKRKITIFTGVSGSGKSSIVFDTIANEAQRLLNENFSLFIRNFLPCYPQPEADAIENLSMAIVVDQKRLGGGSHSTVGTITDIYSILRRLFWRIGQPFVGPVNVFSFNDPQGMCPNCNGLGRKLDVDLDKFVDKSKSLNEGAILFPEYAVNAWGWSLCIQTGLFDPDKKLSKYTQKEMDLLLYSEPRKVKTKVGAKEINLTFQGIIEKFASKYIKGDVKTKSERTQKAVAPYMTVGPCSLCKGARLGQAVLKCKINGRNIAELANMEITELIEFVKAMKDPIAQPIVNTLVERLRHLVDIGLEYLNLNRETDTLSGGESQRIKIVKHLSSSLMDVMYVFDEPSVGVVARCAARRPSRSQALLGNAGREALLPVRLRGGPRSRASQACVPKQSLGTRRPCRTWGHYRRVVTIRPMVFLEGFFLPLAGPSVRNRGRIELPFGRGKTSPVATADVARVVAAVLAGRPRRAGCGSVIDRGRSKVVGCRERDVGSTPTEYTGLYAVDP